MKKRLLAVVMMVSILMSFTGGITMAEEKAETPATMYSETGDSVHSKFIDVSTSQWYYNAVDYVYENNIFAGTSENTFDPDGTMTRGMFATVLYKLAGNMEYDTEPGELSFTDVDPEAYYANPIAWAVTNGLCIGVGDNQFSPERTIDRQEMAVMISRFIDFTDVQLETGEPLEFNDSDTISIWATEYVDRVSGLQIFSGYPDGSFKPLDTTSRAECASIFTKLDTLLRANEGPSNYTGSVNIVHINDIHGYVSEDNSAIGFAKMAGFYDQKAAENPNTLFLDAGDCFSGSTSTSIDQGESVVPILNSVGIDAMVAGNHDFNYGTEQLLKLAGMVNYPVLSANMVYKETDENILDGYEIMTLDNGMKVAVIGLTTPVAESMGAANVKYVDAIETCQDLVDELKPQVDLVIALTHLGDAEGGDMTSVMLANEVTGLDLIIDGHSHTELPEGRVENGVLIAQTGEYSHNIGLVELAFEDGELVDSTAQLITKANAADLPEKEETAGLVAELEATSSAYFSEVIGSTSVKLDGTRNAIRTGETNLGSLFADVMREAAGAEIGLFKAGIIGGEIEPGDITRGNLVEIARVNSLVIVKEVTGADILEFLNYYLSPFPNASGEFQQISGISYVIDPDLTEDKVFNVMVDGQPLDLDRVYTVATVLGSNDGPGMANGTLMGEVDFTMSIMEEYIKNNSPINCGTDGRISTGTKPAAAAA